MEGQQELLTFTCFLCLRPILRAWNEQTRSVLTATPGSVSLLSLFYGWETGERGPQGRLRVEFEPGFGFSSWLFFYILFIHLFIGRGDGREKVREKHGVLVKHQSIASHTPRPGDLARNPGTCPDQESNQQPSGFQAGIQSYEPLASAPDRNHSLYQ